MRGGIFQPWPLSTQSNANARKLTVTGWRWLQMYIDKSSFANFQIQIFRQAVDSANVATEWVCLWLGSLDLFCKKKKQEWSWWSAPPIVYISRPKTNMLDCYCNEESERARETKWFVCKNKQLAPAIIPWYKFTDARCRTSEEFAISRSERKRYEPIDETGETPSKLAQ